MPVTGKYNCEYCLKDISKSNKSKHIKICKPKYQTQSEKDAIIDQRKRKTKGQLFFITFTKGFIKYKLVFRLNHLLKDILGYVIANETGAGYLPSPHTHLVIKTVQKMDFNQFKEWWDIHKLQKYNDIEAVRNLKTSIKYVLKEDYRGIVYGFDKDMTPVITKAYICANKWKKLNYTLYPYSGMGMADKKRFEAYFEQFKIDERQSEQIEMFDNTKLRPWQKVCKRLLLEQGERTVMWIYDPIGDNGKTFLAKYCKATLPSCILLESGKKADIANAYNGEEVVIFDYTRSMAETVNYSILENFKNGYLFAPKYNSSVKQFKPCKVMCLANFEPNLSKLSQDRWMYFLLDKNKLLIQ